MPNFTLILLISLVFTGCSTRYSKAKKTAHQTSYSSSTQQHSSQTLDRLYQQYKAWKNVPYLFGGTTKRGVDCSAFIQNTYLVQFNVKVSRSTKTLRHDGYKISKSRLRAGDMVFFKTGRNTRHVGIYLENGKFMHASSNKGVTISSLQESYWRSHYTYSRRVLN